MPSGVARGGYVPSDAGGLQPGEEPDVILIATARRRRSRRRRCWRTTTPRSRCRCCLEWFEAQPYEYRDGAAPRRHGAGGRAQAGVAQCWHQRWLATRARSKSRRALRRTADHKTLFREYGFTAEAVAAAAELVQLDN